MVHSFFSFWVRNLRVTFLAIILLVAAGVFSLINIPKESSPDIEFGILSVSTVYPWVNPVDIDSIITDTIEAEVKDLEGVKKVNSTSSVGSSNITLELEPDAITRNVLTDVKDRIDKLNFPEDVEDPVVTELSTSNTLVFELLLYWDEAKFDQFELKQKAQVIKSRLEGKDGVATISLAWADVQWFWWGGNSSDYDIKVLLDRDKVELLWLSLNNIAGVIRAFNANTSIGNYQVWDLKYDFRFEGELDNLQELRELIIRDDGDSQVRLQEIAEFKREYPDQSIRKLWSYNDVGYNYTSISFNKWEGANIFKVSAWAKTSIEELLQEKEFDWLEYSFTNDLSEVIVEDYKNLSETALITLVLVFITILLFVGFRESLVATLLLPLAFMITFIILDAMWLSLNFLTNFSLVLTLWIAIDTVIVIIEWASEKTKLWYTRISAILLAIRDFKSPLISGTLTTLSAFLPMIFLPWVIGKFLAYIPITVFTTLLAALVLSLTLSSWLFVKLIRQKPYYIREPKLEANLSKEDTLLLEIERKWREARDEDKLGIRDSILWKLGSRYTKILLRILQSPILSLSIIVVPIILMVVTFISLSPKIGFTLFPATDEWVLNIEVTARQGTDKDYFVQFIDDIDEKLSSYEEIEVFYTSISDNLLSLSVNLYDAQERKEKGQRDIFLIEELLIQDLEPLASQWLQVNIAKQANGPPTWDPVWVKLVADSTEQFDVLRWVSEDFENYLRGLEWTKSISSSSSETPGQFVFEFDNDKLSNIWLTPDDLLRELFFYTNGLTAWSIKSTYEDNDIVLSFADFEEKLNPKDISDIVILTSAWNIRIGDFADYTFKKSVSSISRENWKITISVGSKLETGFLPTDLQPKLEEFAGNYIYPQWISFTSGWEQSENSELIFSTFRSLFISLFLIFSILVFQFNSFRQPVIVLYSVILALLWVNVWLYITGNPYSMPFGIWFIALTWIVVNDAIILIDKINTTLGRKASKNHDTATYEEQVEKIAIATKSRLQPVIVTTLTTVFWLLPLALQDPFWAGLWYTVVFWLIVWSTMTLFAIPVLYKYFVLKKEKKKKSIIKNFFSKIFWIFKRQKKEIIKT